MLLNLRSFGKWALSENVEKRAFYAVFWKPGGETWGKPGDIHDK